MKKLMLLLIVCCLSHFTWATDGKHGNCQPIDSSCVVYLSMDSSNTGEIILIANAVGNGPFTYLWSNNTTTPSTTFTQPGINYCVTITSADGCTAAECLYTSNCYLSIGVDSVFGLVTSVGGVFPMSFQWSDGSSQQNLLPSSTGNYCVTMTDAIGCTRTACQWWGPLPDSCGVHIAIDTSLGNTGSYPLLATVVSTTNALYTYLWSYQNATTESIFVTDPGDYCVTVTHSDGLVCEACINIPEVNAGINQTCVDDAIAYYAFGSYNFQTYLWNTGETSQTILPVDEGEYCVTVTALNSSTASVCLYFDPNSQWVYAYQVTGEIMKADSTEPYSFAGIAELYKYNETDDNFELHETTPLITDNSTYPHTTYEFDSVEIGDYIVKIILDSSDPYYADYLPTYYGNAINWDEAEIIHLPQCWVFRNVVLVESGNLIGGSGEINGIVTQSDNFTANDEGDRSGTPRPNTSVILYDHLEQPLAHTWTEEEGRYRFSHLSIGTYKVQVEIVGMEQAEIWVNLSEQHPVSDGNDFEVTESGIVLGAEEAILQGSLQVSPNPARSVINLRLESEANHEVVVEVLMPDGQKILSKQLRLAKGGQTIALDVDNLTSGLYFLQVSSGMGTASTKFVKH